MHRLFVRKLLHGGILGAATDACALNNAVGRNFHMRHHLADDALTFGTGGAGHLFGLWTIAHGCVVVACVAWC